LELTASGFAEFFQGLEKSTLKVPTIGNFPSHFSKGWINSQLNKDAAKQEFKRKVAKDSKGRKGTSANLCDLGTFALKKCACEENLYDE